jgi:DNA-binding NarL/FixJ family response regulator
MSVNAAESIPFRVMIVDDHAHAREAMRLILEDDASFVIVAEAEDGQQAVELTDQLMPDLILMDIHMPVMDGLETTRMIKAKYPYVKIVMVTVSDDIIHLFEAIKWGAQGYLLKNLNPSAWRECLKAFAMDEAPMTRETANRILIELSPKPQVVAGERSPLTPREQELLGLVARGLSNREISEKLSISEHTVKNHLKNILHKLHLENRVQLTRYAYERGWIRP